MKEVFLILDMAVQMKIVPEEMNKKTRDGHLIIEKVIVCKIDENLCRTCVGPRGCKRKAPP